MRGLERGLGPRLGLPTPGDAETRPAARPNKRPIWLHGASVGESLSALALARLLAERCPGQDFLITSGTVDGIDVVRKRIGCAGLSPCGFVAGSESRVTCLQAPVDLPCAVWAFRRRWQPSALLVIEADLWPSMLVQCSQTGIPLVLVDGRMSERSAGRWGSWLLKPLMAYLLARFDLVLCQSAADESRLRTLGASKARCIGSIKGAAGPLPVNTDTVKAVHEALNGHACGAASAAYLGRCQRRVWLAASTHEKEEELVAIAHHQVLADTHRTHEVQDFGFQSASLQTHPAAVRPLLVIIPRHPRRCVQVVEMLAKLQPNWSVVMYTKMTSISMLASTDVLVVDVLGVMGDWYSIADVALVGGSLVDGIGGHNVMEAAQLGCVPLHGPFNENGQHLIDALRSIDATCIQQVSSPAQLAAAVLTVMRPVRGERGETRGCGPLQSAARAAAKQVSHRTCIKLAAAVTDSLIAAKAL